MNVKEVIQKEIEKLNSELASLPTEVYLLEYETWTKIKAFFFANPLAAQPVPEDPKQDQ